MGIRFASLCLAACALMLLGGCAEGDNITVTNDFGGASGVFRGTDARDTLDLNIGTDAGFNADEGPGIFSGPDGSILLLFKQTHESQQGTLVPQALTEPYNYARVLADEPGPIMNVDDHAGPNYQHNIEYMRQSWNLRYVALLNQFETFSQRLKLVVWDFTAGAFIPAAHIADSQLFALGPSSEPYLSAQDLFVDNTGRVTVIFQATSSALPDGTDRALWAVQYDTATQSIVRSPTLISGAFLQPGDSNNEAQYIDGRMAANGDIAMLMRRVDNHGGAAAPDYRAVLYSVVYKAAADTWGPATQADNGVQDRFGAPMPAPASVVLDTDAHSFQYAFIQNSSTFGFQSSVYTSRFISSAGSAFPAPTRVDFVAGNVQSVSDPQFGGGVDIHFGRDGTSFVQWVQSETGAGPDIDTYWMSSSTETTAPAPANSAELLDASHPAHAGYTISGLRSFFSEPPKVAFDDAGNALIAFIAFNNDTTPDAELYVATFNGSAFTPATVGSGNLAALPAVQVGNSRSIQSPNLSGFSAGANPHCVLGWATEIRTVAGTLVSGSCWGLAYTGLTPAGPPVQLDFSQSVVPFVLVTSSNRYATNAKFVLGLGDPKLRTDEYPAYGTGTAWLLNVRLAPPAPTRSSSYQEVRMIGYNPAVHTNVVENGSSIGTLGQLDHFENWSLLGDGSIDAAWGVNGLHFQRSYLPPAGAGADPAGSAIQTLTPPDMKSVSSSFPQGLHVDGINWIRTAGGTGVVATLVNVPRRWTLWMAQDTKSQRIFGVRSR